MYLIQLKQVNGLVTHQLLANNDMANTMDRRFFSYINWYWLIILGFNTKLSFSQAPI